MRRVMHLLVSIAAVVTVAVMGMRGEQTPATLEAACERNGATVGALSVRVPWQTAHASSGSEVQFCVLRGAPDAPLEFERNAEIVYFVVLGTRANAKPAHYTFRVHTSTGRTIEQGPALIEPGRGFRRGCRAEVCQFITEPAEHVTSVGVDID